MRANHSDVATSLNYLAWLDDAQGRYNEAERLYIQALAVFGKTLPEGHPNMATAQNNFLDK